MSYDSGNTKGNNGIKYCFICGAVNSSNATRCHECGVELMLEKAPGLSDPWSEPEKSVSSDSEDKPEGSIKKKSIGKLPLLILLAIAIGFILGLGMNRKDTSSSGISSVSSRGNTSQVLAEDETGEAYTASDNVAEKNLAESSEEHTAGFSEDDLIKCEYMYCLEGIDAYVFFLSIRNTSDTSVAVSGEAIRKNKDGTILESQQVVFPVLGSGDESINTFCPSAYEEGDTIEYDLHYEEADSDIRLSDLSIKEALHNNHVTSRIQNPTDSFVILTANALFFDEDGTIVDWSAEYGKLYPGKEVFLQNNSYEYFDHIRVFYTWGFQYYDQSDYLSEDNLDIEEKASAWIDNTYYHCLEVTNHSTEDMVVAGNAVARDSSGHAVGGASDWDIYLAPGEKSLLTFCFYDLTEVDKISCSVNCRKARDCYSAGYDTSANCTKTDNGLEISITNNGDESIEPVDVRVLFFNKNMELIDYELGWVHGDEDNGYSIEPGETCTDEIYVFSDYVYKEIYYYAKRYAS